MQAKGLIIEFIEQNMGSFQIVNFKAYLKA